MDLHMHSYLTTNTSSLLSLQLLDEIYLPTNTETETSIPIQPLNELQIETSNHHQLYHNQNTQHQNIEHKQSEVLSETKYEGIEIKEREDPKQPESFDNEPNELNEDNHISESEEFAENKENFEEGDTNVISSISLNNPQNLIKESESPEVNIIKNDTAKNSLNFPQEELNFLLELKRQTINSLNSKESPEQIQENLEVLFKKVEGIINEIEQRNEIITKQTPHNLSIVSKVFELCIKNDENNWIRFPSLNTLENCSEENDENSKINFKTEYSSAQTPSSSATIFKKTQLLTLTKQLPYAQESHNLLNSVRSSRSKSKGIAVVSLEKEKKCLKVTLVNKNNTMKAVSKKNVPKPENLKNEKNERKASVFNANNFFSSKRVSTKIF